MERELPPVVGASHMARDLPVTRGSAGGRARAAALTSEQRSAAASSAARVRWAGGALAPGQVERVARAVLAMWAARADLLVARPSREDVAIDEIVTPASLEWAAPLQIKGVARDGLTVHAKYRDSPLLLCYVFLGANEGGLESRQETSITVLEPSVAWSLPTKLGMTRDEQTDSTYRWPVVGARLKDELDPFTARDPGMLATMLASLAPLRR